MDRVIDAELRVSAFLAEDGLHAQAADAVTAVMVQEKVIPCSRDAVARDVPPQRTHRLTASTTSRLPYFFLPVTIRISFCTGS
jgi:hypothetical protein